MSSIFNLPMQPYPTNNVHTESSQTQAETENLLYSVLRKSIPPPPLQKSVHAQYLAKFLFAIPAPYISLDASRPWLLYWILHSFDILGVALDQGTKDRGIATILSFQHPKGSFSGGPGQNPHLLPTYASICSLAILGGGWDKIDRKGIYEFFMECKKSDGSFVVCKNGEVDVRGIYCLLVVATLLDILTPELVANTDTFIANCQTYEGGFASSSFLCSSSSPALAESHGGYASCALFSHFLLRPAFPGTTPAPIDIENCLRWAVAMQASPREGGGFRGRENKLVDGCYGWWIGGLFAVLDSLVREEEEEEGQDKDTEGKAEVEWEEEDKESAMLFNRVALQEYILVLAQSDQNGLSTKGGLRDKPGKSADLYHTANNLAGLSCAQHLVRHSAVQIASNKASWNPSDPPKFLEGKANGEEIRKEVWARALGWVEDEERFLSVGGEDNRVNTTSPVFNILLLRVKPFMDYFYGQKDF